MGGLERRKCRAYGKLKGKASLEGGGGKEMESLGMEVMHSRSMHSGE